MDKLYAWESCQISWFSQLYSYSNIRYCLTNLASCECPGISHLQSTPTLFSVIQLSFRPDYQGNSMKLCKAEKSRFSSRLITLVKFTLRFKTLWIVFCQFILFSVSIYTALICNEPGIFSCEVCLWGYSFIHSIFVYITGDRWICLDYFLVRSGYVWSSQQF